MCRSRTCPGCNALAGLASRCLTARPTLQIRCRMSDVWCLICESLRLFVCMNSHHSQITIHNSLCGETGNRTPELSQPTVFKTASSTNRTLSKYNVWCRMCNVWFVRMLSSKQKLLFLQSFHPCIQSSYPIILVCVSSRIRTYLANSTCFTDRLNSPSLRTHICFADKERFELSTYALTGQRSTVELFILFGWPGENRTHNPRIKSSVHLTVELRAKKIQCLM